LRRPGSAQQRVWLGPDRHRGRRGDTVAYTEPESYAHSNSYAFGMWSDGIANSNGLTEFNANCDSNNYCYSHCNNHSYCDAHRDRNGYG
jgi:hypothetical protein